MTEQRANTARVHEGKLPEGKLPEGELPEGELQQRVIFSLLGPAIRSAASSGVPMKAFAAWVQVAYFEHLRHAGMTLKEASEVLGVSERTAKRLSQQFKTSFLRPEFEHNLPVKIEFMLRATPMSGARLAQVLKEVPPETIQGAIDRLLDEGRIAENPGRTVTYQVVKSINSLVRDTWLARIGGLNSLLENLSDTIRGRFFEMDARSFARTMTFHVRPERYARLQEIFDLLVEEIARLDEDAQAAEETVPVRLSLFFSPFDRFGGEADPEDKG